jgi:retron-type reverse transcriptase
MLKASGKKGVPQGGVISPLLSNLYLNEVDRMLEQAREVTRNGKYTYIEYARFAHRSREGPEVRIRLPPPKSQRTFGP